MENQLETTRMGFALISKLHQRGYMMDYIRDYYKVFKGDTRSLDYSSWGGGSQKLGGP